MWPPCGHEGERGEQDEPKSPVSPSAPASWSRTLPLKTLFPLLPQPLDILRSPGQPSLSSVSPSHQLPHEPFTFSFASYINTLVTLERLWARTKENEQGLWACSSSSERWRGLETVCAYSAWHTVSSDSVALKCSPFPPVLSTCLWICSCARRKLWNDNCLQSCYTPTHRHTPPHHEEEHPAIAKLDCTVFVVMSRELDRAADLKQLRALSLKEREGKGGWMGPGRGRCERGGFELAACVSETWEKT